MPSSLPPSANSNDAPLGSAMDLGAALELLRHEEAYLPIHKDRSHFGTSEALTAIAAAMADEKTKTNTTLASSKTSSMPTKQPKPPKIVELDEEDDEALLVGGNGAASRGKGPLPSAIAVAGTTTPTAAEDDWAAQAVADTSKYAHMKAAISPAMLRLYQQQEEQQGAATGASTAATSMTDNQQPAHLSQHIPTTTMDALIAYSTKSPKHCAVVSYVIAHFMRTAEGVGLWTHQLKKVMTERFLSSSSSTSPSISTSRSVAAVGADHQSRYELLVLLNALFKVWSPFAVITAETFKFTEFLASQAVPWLLMGCAVDDVDHEMGTTTTASNDHNDGQHKDKNNSTTSNAPKQQSNTLGAKNKNKTTATNDRCSPSGVPPSSSSSSVSITTYMSLLCALQIIETITNDMHQHTQTGNFQHYLGPQGDEFVWKHLRGQCVAAVSKVGQLLGLCVGGGDNRNKKQTPPPSHPAQMFTVSLQTILVKAIITPLYDERADIRSGTHQCCELDRQAGAQRRAAEAEDGGRKAGTLPPFNPMANTVEAIAAVVSRLCVVVRDVSTRTRGVLELILALQIGAYDTEVVIVEGLRKHLLEGVRTCGVAVGQAASADSAYGVADDNSNKKKAKVAASAARMDMLTATASLGLEAAMLMAMAADDEVGDDDFTNDDDDEEVVECVWRAIIGAGDDTHNHNQSPNNILAAVTNLFTQVVVNGGLRRSTAQLRSGGGNNPSRPAADKNALVCAGVIMGLFNAVVSTTNAQPQQASSLLGSSFAADVASAWFGYCAALGAAGNKSTSQPTTAAAVALLQILTGGSDDSSFVTTVLTPLTHAYPHLFLRQWCELIVDTPHAELERIAFDVLVTIVEAYDDDGRRRAGEEDGTTATKSSSSSSAASSLLYQLLRNFIATLSSSDRAAKWRTSADFLMKHSLLGDLWRRTRGGHADVLGSHAPLAVAAMMPTPAAMLCEELSEVGMLQVQKKQAKDATTCTRSSTTTVLWCHPSAALWLRWLALDGLLGDALIRALIDFGAAPVCGESKPRAAPEKLLISSDGPTVDDDKPTPIPKANAFMTPADIGAMWDGSAHDNNDNDWAKEATRKAIDGAAGSTDVCFTVSCIVTYVLDDDGHNGHVENDHDESAKEEGSANTTTALSSATTHTVEQRADTAALILIGNASQEAVVGTVKAVLAALEAGKACGTDNTQSSSAMLFAEAFACAMAGKEMKGVTKITPNIATDVLDLALQTIAARIATSNNYRLHRPLLVTAVLLPILRDGGLALAVGPSEADGGAATQEEKAAAVVVEIPRHVRKLCADLLCNVSFINPQWWLGAVVTACAEAMGGLVVRLDDGESNNCIAAIAKAYLGGSANAVLKWLHCLCGVLAEVVFVDTPKSQEDADERSTTSLQQVGYLASIGGTMTAATAPTSPPGKSIIALAVSVYETVAANQQGLNAYAMSAVNSGGGGSSGPANPIPPPAAVMAACRDFVCLYLAATEVVAAKSRSDSSIPSSIAGTAMVKAITSTPSVQLNYLYFISRVPQIVGVAEGSSSKASTPTTTISGAAFLMSMQQQQQPPQHQQGPSSSPPPPNNSVRGTMMYASLLASWKSAHLKALLEGMVGPTRATATSGRTAAGTTTPNNTVADSAKVLFSFIAQLIKVKSSAAVSQGQQQGLALSPQEASLLQQVATNEGVPMDTRTLLQSVMPML